MVLSVTLPPDKISVEASKRTMRKKEILLGIPAGLAWIAMAILYCYIGLCVLAVVWPICLIMDFLGKGQWPARKRPLAETITGQQSPPNKVATMPITNPTLSNRWQIEFFGGMQRRPRLARAFPIPGDPALQMTAPWPLDPSSANLPQPSSVRILRMVRRCFAPTAIDEFPRADYHFYTMGLPYYVAGRFGALHWLSPVAGTLLHHAVEMLLKGRLAHCYSLKDLKDSNKFGHNLGKCWTGFKAIFSTEDLSPFDHVVTKLNEFEKLRYPDDLLKFGAHISIGFRTGTLMSSHTPPPVEPIYELSVTDLDAFMDRLFKLCGINPEAYLQPYNNAVEFVERHNVACRGWFPQREKDRQA